VACFSMEPLTIHFSYDNVPIYGFCRSDFDLGLYAYLYPPEVQGKSEYRDAQTGKEVSRTEAGRRENIVAWLQQQQKYGSKRSINDMVEAVVKALAVYQKETEYEILPVTWKERLAPRKHWIVITELDLEVREPAETVGYSQIDFSEARRVK